MEIVLNDLTSLIKTRLGVIYSPAEIRLITFALYAKALNFTSAQVLANSDAKIPNLTYNQILDWIKRLELHEPLQYVLGEEDFYRMKFKVNPAVLIPRPETEELVERIINDNSLKNPEILDIGTGSGCIAIALAKNVSDANVKAIDFSEQALEIASTNARLNEVEVDFFQHDIFNSLPDTWNRQFDIVVSNPPYIPAKQKEAMEPNVLSFEPASALFVPDDEPLVFYRRIAGVSQEILKPGGWLYFEINEHFGGEMFRLLHNLGYENVTIFKDIHQKDRITKAQWKSTSI